jgi:hypothetical protein
MPGAVLTIKADSDEYDLVDACGCPVHLSAWLVEGWVFRRVIAARALLLISTKG